MTTIVQPYRLIGRIYDAVLEPAIWREVIEDCKALVNANAGSLITLLDPGF